MNDEWATQIRIRALVRDRRAAVSADDAARVAEIDAQLDDLGVRRTTAPDLSGPLMGPVPPDAA